MDSLAQTLDHSQDWRLRSPAISLLISKERRPQGKRDGGPRRERLYHFVYAEDFLPAAAAPQNLSARVLLRKGEIQDLAEERLQWPGQIGMGGKDVPGHDFCLVSWGHEEKRPLQH